jgi:hypothetical protein
VWNCGVEELQPEERGMGIGTRAGVSRHIFGMSEARHQRHRHVMAV